MKGALMAGMAGKQRASGLTLVEVLSTVFIMGLGLIMVAAAFPVGIDQVRRSVEDTQSAMAARNAVELLHGENIFQNMTKEEWDDLVDGSRAKVWAHGENLASNHYRVHNPWRRLYIDNTHEAMWPPEPGDLLWRAFLMRLTETDEMPLFRVTLVVVKYSKQSPELYIPTDPSDPVSSRTIEISSNSPPDECAAPPSELARLVEGDYLMDPYTGFCYRIASFREGKMYLATETDPKIPRNTTCWVFSNVVGIYYTMISG